MRRSFSYTLLITWFFLIWSCKTQYIQSSVEYRNMVVSDSLMPVDNQLVVAYIPYKIILEKDMLRVISVTSEEMVKEKPESNLTNFLADLLLDEGKEELNRMGKEFKPDISYFNYGGIRTYLPKGEITVGKIFELMPFENELVFLKLSGIQVLDFLNGIARGGGDSLGGVKFKISENRAKSIVVGEKPLNPDSYYWMVTNDYVAAGGDDREVLTQNHDYVAGGKKIRDVIISHLEKKYESGEVIKVKPDGRISYE
jgi:2',3'-cyclic-nucleotide 2'-phosphodiesterase (5'-nucleotidase family)